MFQGLVLSLMLWLLLSVVSHLYKMAANDSSQYVISAKGEVQSMGVADVRGRGVRFGFDDWVAFPEEIGRCSHGCSLVQGLREIPCWEKESHVKE